MSRGLCRYIVLLAAFLSAALFPLTARAHEVRPAFLKISQTGPQQFDVLWKQPIIENKRLKITPQFPDGCAVSPERQETLQGAVASRFTVRCALDEGQISLAGLERTLTDVFVEITYTEGAPRSALLKPAAPALLLDGPARSPAFEYLRIGAEHIWLGWDHLLFVIGLTLLVAGRKIWGVASAFTLAHSLTLGLAALGWLVVASRPVELLIAASIALLAVEVLRKLRGQDSLSARRPYLISFGIGLIHGLGFASALSGIGLPKGTELLALLLFNIGVELGQFLVIGVCIAVLAALVKFLPARRRAAEIMACYVMGTISLYWMIERGLGYWA